jgi:hypothetical protein
MLKFNQLLRDSGGDPSAVRLVRHKHNRRFQRQLFQDAINRHARFDQYQTGQSNPSVIAQMSSAAALAVFVVDPGGETVFIGLWRVDGSRTGHSPDPYRVPPNPPQPGSVVFDLVRLGELSEYTGRLVVDWGGGERAWVQYAHRRDKAIVELRRRVVEPPFPGYSRFVAALNEVDALPDTWLEPLRVARGVYLIVHRATGVQYVGAATGQDGFLGRWRCYADGHGGNVALRELGQAADQYDVQILETVGSGADVEDICALETVWKEKLGSRVRGLNRN